MTHKKTIHRSLILGSAVFIAFMCFLLSIQAYLTYSQSLYKRYDDKLSNILNYATNRIDMDDLYQNTITAKRPKSTTTCNSCSTAWSTISSCSTSTPFSCVTIPCTISAPPQARLNGNVAKRT